jgi:hypothetical protein
MNIYGYEKKLKLQKKERIKLDKEIRNLEDRLYFARSNKQKNIRIHKDDEETVSIEYAEGLLNKLRLKSNHLSGRINYNLKMILKEREKKKKKGK